MTFKTILVQGGVEVSAVAGVQAALALGAPLGATVIGVGAVSPDAFLLYMDPSFAFASGDTLQAMQNGVEADIIAAEARFHELASGYPHPVAWRSRRDDPHRVMAEVSLCADLIVVARPPKGYDRRRLASPSDMVMESGLPVLLVGTDQTVGVAQTVLIGWKNTRESRRAVTDALPLLQLAERVHVAAICEADAVGTVQPYLDEVVARLSRHGIKAERLISPQVEPTVADDLIALATRVSADLIVVGAYGHSRLREWAFGGVTDDLMCASPKTVLFSR